MSFPQLRQRANWEQLLSLGRLYFDSMFEKPPGKIVHIPFHFFPLKSFYLRMFGG